MLHENVKINLGFILSITIFRNNRDSIIGIMKKNNFVIVRNKVLVSFL